MEHNLKSSSNIDFACNEKWETPELDVINFEETQAGFSGNYDGMQGSS
nr:hypothetical protein [uncultured Draconibacterium sp.]